MKQQARIRLPILALTVTLLALAPISQAAGVAQETQQEPPEPVAAQPSQEPAGPPAVDPAEFPAVVAKVNDFEIPRKDLIGTAISTVQQLRAFGQPPPPQDANFYSQVLDQVIANVLLFQESQAQGVTVSDEEVQARVAAFEQQAGGPEQFEQVLQEQEVTRDEVAQTLSEGIAIERYVEEKVAPAITVSEQEAQRFYSENQQQMQRPEQVRASHILIEAGADADDEQKAEARQKAESLLAQLREGADFAALAEAESGDPGSAQQGGDLGWLSRGQVVEPFENAVFALEPGQTSEVVETPFGFHIIQLAERRAAGTAEFTEVKPQIERHLEQQKLQEVLLRKVEELEQNAEIERFI